MTAMRVVATGTAADGSDIVASDAVLPEMMVALMPGAGFVGLWGSDTATALPNAGARPAAPGWFPPATGYRVEAITLPPDSTHPPANLDMPAAMAEIERKLPGLIGHMDPKHPGMHRTDTVDFNYVVSGRCVVELASGAKIELGPGDSLVMNGARHAWHVPYPEPCRLLTFSVGASRGG